MPVPVEKLVVPVLPAALTHECPPLPEYTSGELAVWMAEHGDLVAAAKRCAARHKALVDTLERIREENE